MFQTTTETIPKCVLFSQKAKKKCKESVQYNSDLNIRMNIFSTTFHRRGVAKAFPFEWKSCYLESGTSVRSAVLDM